MKEFIKDLFEAMGGKYLLLYLSQLVVWAIIILALPMATWLSTQDFEAAKTSLNVVWGILQSPFFIYLFNFSFFGPLLFFMNDKEAYRLRSLKKLSNKTRYLLFGLCNLLSILLLNSRFIMLWFHRDSIPNLPEMTPEMWIGFFSGVFMFLLLNCVVIGIAIGVRHFIRTRHIRQQLLDEKAKNTEAELAWLKNQINPHFLFNTLNNISSLTQIDPDKAQESIGQLSDLLRYALYDSEAEKVQLASEIEFMDNYIDLMALRCNEMTKVEKNLEAPSRPVEVAPLLFISLVENAFKHGVNARHPSFVKVSMQMEGDDLVFTCDNSLFEKQGTDRIGSGIGLENMKRRLELLYPGRYTYEQTATGDTYHVKVTLKAL